MGRRKARDGEKKLFYFIFLGDLQSKTVSLRGGVFNFCRTNTIGANVRTLNAARAACE
jgi:hypothetical protein